MTWDSTTIDEAFAPFAGNITAFTDVLGTFEDADKTQRFRVSRLHVETPVELDLRIAADGSLALGAAPPIYRTEITIQPVFHTLRMTLVPQPPRAARPKGDAP